MDTKRLVIGMLLAMAIVVGWQQFYLYLAKKNNWKLPGDQSTAPTQQVATNSSAPPSTQLAPAITTQPNASTTTGPAYRFADVPPSPNLTYVGSAQKEDATYALQLNISPRGA